MLAAPLLFLAMKAVAAPLRRGERRAARRPPSGVALPARVHTVVLVVEPARADAAGARLRPGDGPGDAARGEGRGRGGGGSAAAEWEERGVPVPLVVIESPYRETVRPVLRYVRQLRREHPGDVISIVIPEYVVAHWWQHLLHNQTALRLKAQAAVRALGDRHERAVGAGRRGGAPAAMSDPVTYVRSEDLLDESSPRRLARAFGLSRRRQSGLVLALLALPLLTLLLEALEDTFSLEGQVLLYLLAVVVIAVVGGMLVAVGSADRRGAAHQLLLRRARPHARRSAQPEQVVDAGGVRGRRGAGQRGGRARRAARARGGAGAARRPRRCRRSRAPSFEESESLHEVLERAREDVRHGVGHAEASRPAGTGDWIDAEHAAGRRPARRRRFASTCPSAPHLRLVGRGPALFAEDQRVLEAFARRRADRVRGPAAQRRGRRGARRWRPPTGSGPRCSPRSATTCARRWPGSRRRSSSLRQTDVEWSEEERDELLRDDRGVGRPAGRDRRVTCSTRAGSRPGR